MKYDYEEILVKQVLKCSDFYDFHQNLNLKWI